MVPILSFLLAFLRASIPLVPKLASSSAQCHLLSDHHLLGLSRHFGTTFVTPVFLKCLSGWKMGQRGGSQQPEPVVPTLSAQPLLHSLNLLSPSSVKLLTFSSFLSRDGGGRPAEINPTDRERLRGSHARSYSHDRCPPGTETCPGLCTHVRPRARHL
jgi:hypothetical protein